MCFFRTLLWLALAGTVSAQAPEPAATPAPAAEVLEVEGLIGPEQEIDLAAPSEGLITEILVPEGSRVAKGDVIARLSDDEEQILLRTAELQRLKLVEDVASTERLYRQSAASRDDYKRTVLDSQRAEAERDLHAIRLEKRKITAPCDAYILRLLKQPGESVQNLEKFAEWVATDRLLVTAYIDGQHLGRIPVGTRAQILPPDDGGRPVEGEVVVSDPVLDPGGKVFRVRVRAEDPERKLVPGTRTKLRFPLPGS